MLIKRQRKRRIYCILRRLKSKKGEGYIDVVVLTIAAMLVKPRLPDAWVQKPHSGSVGFCAAWQKRR
jgi:hypothetical protein